MKIDYLINRNEQANMSCFICNGRDFVKAVFEHLPEKIIRHSERVRELAFIMAGYIPEELLPENMNRSSYRSALSKGAYYHDIGVYLAGNDVESRPDAAERFLMENLHTDISSPFNVVVLETVRNCHERYDGQGYPDGLTGEDIPLHAAICGIADTVDMMMGTGILLNRKAKSATNYIRQNSGVLFRSDAVVCFEQAQEELFSLYLSQRHRVQSLN